MTTHQYVMHLHHSNIENFKRDTFIRSWDGGKGVGCWEVLNIDLADDGWSGIMKVRRRQDFGFNTCDCIGYEYREIFIEVTA